MEAGTVAAITDLKKALLGRLDTFVNTAGPSWSTRMIWNDGCIIGALQETTWLQPLLSRCLPIWEYMYLLNKNCFKLFNS